MTRVKITCYCGAPIKTEDVEDGKSGFTLREVQAECPDCAMNGGDYGKSPHWTDAITKEKTDRKNSPKPAPRFRHNVA